MFAKQAIRRLQSPSSTTFYRAATRAFASEAQSRSSAGAGGRKHEELMTAMGAFLGLAVGTVGIAMTEPQQMVTANKPLSTFQSSALKAKGEENHNLPPPRPDLPTISLEDVAEHCDEDSLWYTFRGAVYDLTFFINGHPGGTPVR